MKNKIAIILGTRPEIIKLSPVIRYCQRKNISHFVLHTNQHRTYLMDKVFFKELQLPLPKYRLSGSPLYNNHGSFTGRLMNKIEGVLLKERPKFVLVQGDTDTTLAGSLVAAKLPGIKLGHVEAGLRSYDRAMPEEINRVVSDHLSDCLFAPTEWAKQNLTKEGISSYKIFVTGNTIVDALKENIQYLSIKINILKRLKLKTKTYVLLTLHRPGNVDDRARLKSILSSMAAIYKKTRLPIVFPVHPRTQRKMKEFKIGRLNDMKTIKPLGFWEFLELERNASIIFTDSGGVQEEACILGVPCVTLRENTERPETVKIGVNVIAGTNCFNILKKTQEMLDTSTAPNRSLEAAVNSAGSVSTLSRLRTLGRSSRRVDKKLIWENPFGKGDSAKKIINILLNC